MTEPAHLVKAREFIGFQERPGNRGIEEFIGGAKTGRVGDAWCAIFANFCFETTGVRGTRSALARSFERSEFFERLAVPRVGCVVTFWRGSASSGQGHVGFYISEDGDEINILSGNDDDQVQIDGHPKSRFTGYWWPKAAVAAIASNRFTDITATVFSDPTVAYQDVPLGWNDRPGVALPWFFKERPRPKVRVTYRGKSVVCDIVDQGPWNRTEPSKGLPGDPYWQTGARPQAESGIDMIGRKTNKAGIDLTPAAADAIGLPGKGLVDWEFVTTDKPEPAMPTPTDDAWEKLERILTNLDAGLSRIEQAHATPALPAPAQTPPSPPPMDYTPAPAAEPTSFASLFGGLFPGLGGPSNAAIGSGGLIGLALPILQMFGQVTPGSTASTTIGTLAAGLIGGGTLGRINTGITLLTSILGALRARNQAK